MLQFPVLLLKLLTTSVSFTTPFTSGASRSFKDAKMRNTVSNLISSLTSTLIEGGKKPGASVTHTWGFKHHDYRGFSQYLIDDFQLNSVFFPLEVDFVNYLSLEVLLCFLVWLSFVSNLSCHLSCHLSDAVASFIFKHQKKIDESTSLKNPENIQNSAYFKWTKLNFNKQILLHGF